MLPKTPSRLGWRADLLSYEAAAVCSGLSDARAPEDAKKILSQKVSPMARVGAPTCVSGPHRGPRCTEGKHKVNNLDPTIDTPPPTWMPWEKQLAASGGCRGRSSVHVLQVERKADARLSASSLRFCASGARS